MSQIIKKENITISIGEYENQGETKQRLKVIGELITKRSDDGTVYQYGELWGPTGSTKFKVFAQENEPEQIPRLQDEPTVQPPEPGYFFANGAIMSAEEASHYRDRGFPPWVAGTAPPELTKKNYSEEI